MPRTATVIRPAAWTSREPDDQDAAALSPCAPGRLRLGAVALQQGTWAVPDREPFEARLVQVVEEIKAAGGQPVVLAVVDEEASAAQLEALFTAQREAEWGEFLSDCSSTGSPPCTSRSA
jgi:hypothetical protein